MTNWIAWDAIEGAMTKTRQMLFEPFDLTKWVKLAIILFFIGGIGGGSSFNSNPSGSNFKDFGDSPSDAELDAFVEETVSKVSAFVDQYMTYIVLTVLVILLVVMLFSYISNVMQFVFVESVVRNHVTIRAYTRNNLGNGLRLFILNWALGITFLTAIILSLLPALSAILDGDISAVFFGSLLTFFLVLVLGVIILSILGSFINLAIPVMLYENVGVLKALSKVVSTAAHSIPQVLVYWIIRGVLGIIIGIAAVIISLIVILIAGLVLLLIGIMVYMILTLLGFGFTDPVTLVVLGLLFIVSLIVLIFLILLATVPLPVFGKYHALLFLQNWYADVVPFWEPVPESVPESVP
ncbi:MAG: hypothetical protein C4B59_17465 [Candidatus Methanogaster sp.]|uniref:Uncharacterized protein n=1 Tax=Candidatus Methanogaster sp. TaxID=3386292 RepID=A0AC61KXS5_9EURY|nr:MAG: hypothetical protein C4B59_17465 [ANME-2 cluster archaeon]